MTSINTANIRAAAALKAYFTKELEQARNELIRASSCFERSTIQLQKITILENKNYDRLAQARFRFDKLEDIVKNC